MSIYYPDNWVLIDIITPEETIRKVFAGWAGGWTEGDSWKLSSGTEKVVEVNEHITDYIQYSGSIYSCHKFNNRMSMYMKNILASWMESIPEGYSIKVVDNE